jgi:excisionase family DNA binding protein
MDMGALLTAKQLQQILKSITLSTIYRMAQQGTIPSYTVGTKGVRFDLEEVRHALRRAVRPTATGSMEPVSTELIQPRPHSNGKMV